MGYDMFFSVRHRTPRQNIGGSAGESRGLAVASLIYRHNRVTRVTHWINAIALLVLFMSGLQIFNAFPELHWGSKAEPDEAFFSITAMNEDGDVRGYTDLFGVKFDTTGFLGVQNTAMGPAPRAFPSWITIPGYFWLAGGRRWHFFFGWLFAINGLLYFAYNLLNGHVGKFFFRLKDATKVPAMIAYYLRLRRESPQEEEYNPLQKIAYTGVFLILTPLVLLSGLAMSPQLDIAFKWLPVAFGGRQSARTIHFILAFAFLLFTFGHVFMVLTTGFLNNMRSMVSGWYKEKVTSLEPDPRASTVAPPAAPKTPTPSLSLGGEGVEETEKKAGHQMLESEVKGDSQEHPKDESDDNEKPKS
jgi:Ni/Fe-hydrogenase b-type cytochrome subunit